MGDIVGRPGQEYAAQCLREMAELGGADLVIANGENATHGRGLNRASAEFLYDAGIEFLTLGNHAWDQKDTELWIDDDARVVRPANYPPGTPGRGYTTCQVKGVPVMIVNVMGRAFLSQLDCPFRAVDQILQEQSGVRHIIVDMHAETTSEKLAMGWYLDGRVSAVLGTHTHVQTADERVLPNGTAYITDVGMVGPNDGILGMDRVGVMHKMMTQRPARFQVADGPRQFCAVVLELDDVTGTAQSIQRIRRVES
ncbi:metallophosphoesterase [Alicyclobacillus contaminans]|nr:metallophosphoesterase [Alicyclobacillus contaminans]